MLKLASLLATLALATSVAHADDLPEHKDPAAATALSIAGTAASAGIFYLGVRDSNADMIDVGLATSLVTPSLGEWYAGKYLTLGMGLRAVGAAVTLAGAVEDLCFADHCPENTKAAALMTVGLIGYASGVVYDIATAHSAAEDYNQKHAVQVAPTMLSGRAVGLGVSGSF